MAICSNEFTRAEQDPPVQFLMVSCHCKGITPCKLPKASTEFTLACCSGPVSAAFSCMENSSVHSCKPHVAVDLPSMILCITQEWKFRSELSPSRSLVTYSKRLRCKDFNSDPFFIPRCLLTSWGWGGSTPYLPLPQSKAKMTLFTSYWCTSLPLLRASLHLRYSFNCNGSNWQG